MTIGNFDGVHRGHQQIIATARRLAHETAGPVVVLTFQPHPAAIIAPDRAPPPLCSLPQKLSYLEEAGADVVVVAESNRRLLGLGPEAFIREIVVGRCHAAHVVEGHNFGFGAGRQGDVTTLRECGARLDFAVHVVEPVRQETTPGVQEQVSSSLIRELLRNGRVELAAEALGRPYELEGRVVAGVGRGRKLGFPTANIEVVEQLIPGDGVYAGATEVGGEWYFAAISIGATPTFDSQVRRVEIHLLDFAGDLYDRPLSVRMYARIREQRKFGSPQELVRQIQADVEQVRQCGQALLAERGG